MERKWWTLIAVCTAIFMLLLDITVVNVALPDIQRDLDASFAQLQWVVDAYALTLATPCSRRARSPTSSAAGGLHDRRSCCSRPRRSLCGIAPSAGVLIGARAVQGVGGGVMFAVSLALLANAFHGRERGTAFGIWGATTGAAVAIGPLVGGVLTEWAGWRWIFFVNIPIGIAAIVVTLMRVDESKRPAAPAASTGSGRRPFSAALFLLVYGLPREREGLGERADRRLPRRRGRPARGVRRRSSFAARSDARPPAVPRPGFVGAQIAAFAISASIFAAFLYLTLYLQNVLGYSPLQAGLRFLPLSLAAFVVAPSPATSPRASPAAG